MQKLERTMTSRHIMMMALGGAIGAGLFKGSKEAIDLAGPSVMIPYLIGGVILLFIMQGLAEMAVRNSEARTFRDLVQSILGPYAAYFLDWIYWKMWVLNIATEAVVAADIFAVLAAGVADLGAGAVRFTRHYEREFAFCQKLCRDGILACSH